MPIQTAGAGSMRRVHTLEKNGVESRERNGDLVYIKSTGEILHFRDDTEEVIFRAIPGDG